jgi:hypothetical protein
LEGYSVIGVDEIESKEAKRAPESFLKESCSEALACHRIFPLEKGNQKNLETTAIVGSIRPRSAIKLPAPNSKDTVIRQT